MKTDVYLDIDGVILANDLTPANYSREFLKLVINNYPTYWLTTHCKGDAGTAVRRLSLVFEPEIVELLKKVKPTNWDLAKTEGIDFSRPFLWFDDDLFYEEEQELRRHNALDNWIGVDLSKNENQLADFIRSFPLPMGN
jgi:hypothetical protein